ncbi:MAG: BMP family ABC transporter substrate-binding protein, partial [Ruminiclostridium sp.]
MKLSKNKRYILLVICFLLLAVIIGILLLMGKTVNKKEKIGIIITGSIDEGGWNGMHYTGASEACRELGAELLVKENIKEFCGDCGPAAEDLVSKGCKMIILTSFGYSDEIKDIIQKYPDVSFYGNDFNNHADNITSFFARMYQARYLAGIAAGMQTKTGHIGYVAAMPTSEVNRGINAFTLGVRRV